MRDTRMDYAAPSHRALVGPSMLPTRRPVPDFSGRFPPDVIFVTNRGPIQHSYGVHGELQTERGAGGVVSGLLCAAEGRRVTWISLAMTEADRAAADRDTSGANRSAVLPEVASRLVNVSRATYRCYYDGFSNGVLWFLQHGLDADCLSAHDQLDTYWRQGYVPANEAVARAVISELDANARAGGTPPIVFHDYHLYLAPAMVRKARPAARLQHFVHIPWPALAAWQRLPYEFVRDLYAGLAANDVVGFQTERDARNFLAGAERYLGARCPDGATFRWQGRTVRAAAYPIAITPRAVTAQAHTAAAEAAAGELLAPLGLDRGRKLILRVDRLEPTKNIVRGFEAYEQLLDEGEALRGRVVFLALLVPSRESLPVYQQYAEQVKATVKRINARFGTPDWQPIVAVYGNDHERALACMRRYDVLLVNPLIDGMNLVVKEGAILNERDGVIVLSTEAGAYSQLAKGVLPVDPRDVEDTTRQLWKALALPAAERKALADRSRGVVLGESAGAWLRRQLADLSVATAARTPGTPAPLYHAARTPLDLGIDPLDVPITSRDLGRAPMLQTPIRDGGRDTVPLFSDA
jgi:trehalose 6-phosphate synthase